MIGTEAGQVNRYPTSAQNEQQRGIPNAMTQLASACGDLETAARLLADRLAPTLTAGNPYERQEKEATLGGSVAAPRPIRSHLCDEIHSRTYSILATAKTLNEMARGTEL